MILLDSSVLSILAKVDRLDLLFVVLGDDLAVSPNVQRELEKGIRAGYQVLQPALDTIRQGQVTVVAITEVERRQFSRIPFRAEKGEADSLAYCLEHGAIFLTNDERAYRRGKALGINCVLFKAFLRSIWEDGGASRQEVRQLITDLETKAGMVIKYQDEIFADAPD
ncbi:MAG: type II toxin-antitoxin system VapC family toxin [Anaerolineae bacterium]